MIKKTITYEDFNGTMRTETFYFNYSKAELLEMEMSTEGGFVERIQRIIDAKEAPALIKLWKKFVIDAYGVKSDDGRRFMKNDDIRAAFVECPAYSAIFMELATDDVAGSEFVKGVVPADMAGEIAAAQAAKAQN
jgi:hypothetical protein